MASSVIISSPQNKDSFSELDALLGIAQRVLKRALGDAQRLRGDADASAVQRGHGKDVYKRQAHEELRAKIRSFAEEEIKPLAFLMDQDVYKRQPMMRRLQSAIRRWCPLPSTAAIIANSCF